MKLYELVFIARQDMSPAQVETLTEKLTTLVKDQKGTVGKTEYCGLRTLAYPIRKNNKGHYVLVNISGEKEMVQELDRIMRLSEDILRFIVLHVEKHEEAPSALLKASRYKEEAPQRDTRGPRGDSRGPRPRRTETPAESKEQES